MKKDSLNIPYTISIVKIFYTIVLQLYLQNHIPVQIKLQQNDEKVYSSVILALPVACLRQAGQTKNLNCLTSTDPSLCSGRYDPIPSLTHQAFLIFFNSMSGDCRQDNKINHKKTAAHFILISKYVMTRFNARHGPEQEGI